MRLDERVLSADGLKAFDGSILVERATFGKDASAAIEDGVSACRSFREVMIGGTVVRAGETSMLASSDLRIGAAGDDRLSFKRLFLGEGERLLRNRVGCEPPEIVIFRVFVGVDRTRNSLCCGWSFGGGIRVPPLLSEPGVEATVVKIDGSEMSSMFDREESFGKATSLARSWWMSRGISLIPWKEDLVLKRRGMCGLDV
ncbi:hypothetical protein Dimus_036843 [Dionaea muscipula]